MALARLAADWICSAVLCGEASGVAQPTRAISASAVMCRQFIEIKLLTVNFIYKMVFCKGHSMIARDHAGYGNRAVPLQKGGRAAGEGGASAEMMGDAIGRGTSGVGPEH